MKRENVMDEFKITRRAACALLKERATHRLIYFSPMTFPHLQQTERLAKHAAPLPTFRVPMRFPIAFKIVISRTFVRAKLIGPGDTRVRVIIICHP